MQKNISFHSLKQISATSLVVVSLFFAIAIPGYSQQPVSANLAKVAILGFEDRTGSPNYAYLSGSLSEAINTGMISKFEYAPIDAGLTQKTSDELRARTGQFSAAEAQEFCKTTGTDILIFGEYEYDALTNQIAIKTKINFALINRIVTLDPLLNPIDASLFQATDVMAAKIVETIAEMARKTMNGTAASSEISANATGEQKVTLAKLDEISWSKVDKAINITGGFAPGFDKKLAGFKSGFLVGVNFLRYSDFRKAYAGFNLLYLNQTAGSATNVGYGGLLLFGLNPWTIGNRVTPFGEFGVGYGVNFLSTLQRAVPGGIWNSFKIGLRILAIQNLIITIDGGLLILGGPGDTQSSISSFELSLGYAL